MENPIKMDDLGIPLFWKHPNIGYINGQLIYTPKNSGGGPQNDGPWKWWLDPFKCGNILSIYIEFLGG